ncbi:hypothetical protein BRADI_5g09390v3 [Brachypodium distachyon]|uniref:FAF domain-containing protein n=1 Tax=Brachypodium distachyon TaxID=15368 RepID=I1IXI3_BRADI|nr:hypothetical protein BRADI_5g09390v3 [Brachypodium distachyon]
MAPQPLHLPPYLSPTVRPRSSAPPFQRPPSPLLHPRSSSSSLLTEALGAESLVDPDDAAMDGVAAAAEVFDGRAPPPCKAHGGGSVDDEADDQAFVTLRRTRSGRAFPPPISVIGKSGRPWLSLRAQREDGRLVLREMQLPSQELLQQCREDGRFKLLRHPEAGSGRCGARGSGIGRGSALEDPIAD